MTGNGKNDMKSGGNTMGHIMNAVPSARFMDGRGNGARPFLLICVLGLLLSGCAVTKSYQKPEIETPKGWRIDLQTAADMANKPWWEQFQDPVLNELIKTALNENKDLRIATARIEEFAGQLQAVNAGFYPQLNYGLGATYDQVSKNRQITFPSGTERVSANLQTNLNLSWELDIWGRLRMASEAARAELLASEEVRQAVILTLVSDVATGYLDLLSLDQQLKIARETLASREEFLRLFERKYEGGQVSRLELAQIRTAYELVAEYIPEIERRISVQENALSVLLGRNPGPIVRDRTMDTLVVPEVPGGIPSDLLVRRPDIRATEQRLIAAHAAIGVVRAQYFPTISLTSLFGFASTWLSNLIQGSSAFFQMGAAALGPLFTGGRIGGEVRQAEARKLELLNEYLGTVQRAFREVNDSLVSVQKNRELLEIEKRRMSALKDNVNFARNRYDAKLVSYLEIVYAERDLFLEELRHTQTRNDLLGSLVKTYKSMGGGWVTGADRLISLSGQQAETNGH
jgi:multidrug efflux system outer membrane protein